MKEIGHIWFKGYEFGGEPQEGLEYQHDYRNDDFYSFYTDEEFAELEQQIKSTGKFDTNCLFHMGEADCDKVEHWLELEHIDDFCNIFKVARLHSTDFGNIKLAKVICKHLFSYMDMDEILEATDDRIECHEPEEELADFKEFLENLQSELLSQKLDSELAVKPKLKVAIKI